MKRHLFLTWLFGAIVVVGAFQNCGKAFKEMDLVDGADLSSLSLPGGTSSDNDLFKVTLNESLLTADQVYASMSEVTGVSPNQDTFDEWNTNARTSLSDNNKISSITAPIMMSVANLGSRFCSQTFDDENIKQRLYVGVNLGLGLSSLSDDAFVESLRNLSDKLWGRAISDEEIQNFLTYKSEFISTLGILDQRRSAKTKVFYLGVCTAMLGSYESLSL